jgi:hypothetical protein
MYKSWLLVGILGICFVVVILYREVDFSVGSQKPWEETEGARERTSRTTRQWEETVGARERTWRTKRPSTVPEVTIQTQLDQNRAHEGATTRILQIGNKVHDLGIAEAGRIFHRYFAQASPEESMMAKATGFSLDILKIVSSVSAVSTRSGKKTCRYYRTHLFSLPT